MAFEGTESSLSSTELEVRDSIETSLKSLERQVREIINREGDLGEVVGAYNQFKNSIPEHTSELRAYGDLLAAEFEEGVSASDGATLDRLTSGVNLQIAGEAERSLGEVSALVIAGALIGTSLSARGDQAAGRISGAFLDSSDPLVVRAQNQLQRLYASASASREEIGAAMDVIRKQVAGVDLSRSLRTTLKGAVSDAVYDFHGAFVLAKGKQLGYTKYRYAGGVVRNSRDFCINHVDREYTEAEIRRIWRGTWQGKRPGDPFVVRGGYNCRHYWVPVK